MKAIILARVSTEEQKEAGNSLPAQLLRLQKHCQDHGLDIAQEFNFDESAWKVEREEFKKIINMLQSSKGTMVLCCDKIDRLIRNFTRDLAVLEELRKAGKIELHFPSDNIILHKDSPATDLFRFTIGVSLAKYYSDSISDNVKRAYENKIKKGEWIGKAPIGYLNITEESGVKDMIIDPIRGDYVAKMFEMYASGNYSLRTLNKETDKMGLTSNIKDGKLIKTSMIDYILSNPFYYGVMKIKGEMHPHKYQPLISKEMFDRVQRIKAGYNKKPFKYASKPFMFRGMIKCADCGCMITAEVHKGHNYYSCTNHKRMHDKRTYIREEDLLAPISEMLKDLRLSDEMVKKIVEELRKANESESRFNEKIVKDLREEYDKIENRISNMLDARFDGNINEEMYSKKLKEYKKRQETIIEEMQKHNKADEGFYITVEKILSLAQRAYEIFESSEMEEKRQLLNFILQNLELKGKNLSFETKTPFETVLIANRCSDMGSYRDSNPG
jgi:site-specific DNA recombinase